MGTATIGGHTSVSNISTSTNTIVNLSAKWRTVIPKTYLKPHNQLIIPNKNNKQKFNFIKLNIYPDGGISRLRIMGKI